MTLRHLLLMLSIAAIWAVNNVMAKYVVSYLHVPPMFYAASRFALVALILLPWLRSPPRPLWRLVTVALLMGAGSFGLMFIGLQSSTPSAAAVVMQLGLPVTTLLSVTMLGERLQARRVIGIVLTFAGAMTVIWDPHGVKISTGLLYVAASAVAGSLGSILMKQMHGVRPIQYQAWVGFVSLWPMAALSLLLEPGQIQAGIDGGWRLAAALLFSVFAVSILSHSLFFWLVQRYEASMIAPMLLLGPLGTIGLGVALFHDPFGPRMIAGAVVALAGVLIITLRPNQMMLGLARLRGR